MTTTKIVEELSLCFDYAKLLEEFLLIKKVNVLPLVYTTEEVYNQGTYTDKIKEYAPYTMEVCDEMKKQVNFNFVLFRLMAPFATLHWHRDHDCHPYSYHIPISTNEGCYYAWETRIFPLHKLGQVYKVYIHSYHTFFNAGRTPRLHLHFIHDNGGAYLRREFAG